MDIYFVRHGESVGNASKRHQPSHTRLSSLGTLQAKAVGKELVALRPTHFISSSQVRAVETAEHIAQSLQMIPETEPVFVELNRPASMYGWHHRSPRSLWYLVLWYLEIVGHPDNPEAGESYLALRTRVRAAQELLVTYPGNAKIVIVSHSVFINMFVAHMNHSGRLSLFQALRTIIKVLHTKNTSVTHIRCTKADDDTILWQQVV